MNDSGIPWPFWPKSPYLTSWQLARLGMPGMPKRAQHINRKALREGWALVDSPFRKGGRLYATWGMPEPFRSALEARMEAPSAAPATAPATAPEMPQKASQNITENITKPATSPPVVASIPVEKINMAHSAPRQRRHPGCVITRDDQLKRYVLALLVAKPHVAASHVQRAITTDLKREVNLRTIQRFLRRWKGENKTLFAHVSNPDRAKGSYQPAFGTQTENVKALNQLWELDSTPADVMLVGENGKATRHHLVGALDIYSRRGRLLVCPTSTAEAIALTLRDGILAWGVPRAIRHDNGADYRSKWIERACRDLGIEQIICPPHTPEAKGSVERFLGTFAHDLVELLPGYVGHDVAEREAIRARQTFAKRLMTKGEVVELKMTAEAFQTFCDDWCRQYEMRPHKGLDKAKEKTPFARAQAWTGDVWRLEDSLALDFLLAPAPGDGSRKVTKKGIVIDGRSYIAIELGAMVGQTVQVRRHPHAHGQIAVFDVHMERRICIAENAQEMEDERRAEIAVQAAASWRKSMSSGAAEHKKAGRSLGLDDVGLRIAADGRAAAEKVAAFPKRSLKHRTKAIEAALAAEPAPVEIRYGKGGRPLNGHASLWVQWALDTFEERDEIDRTTLGEMLLSSGLRALMAMTEIPAKALPYVEAAREQKERAAS